MYCLFCSNCNVSHVHRGSFGSEVAWCVCALPACQPPGAGTGRKRRARRGKRASAARSSGSFGINDDGNDEERTRISHVHSTAQPSTPTTQDATHDDPVTSPFASDTQQLIFRIRSSLLGISRNRLCLIQSCFFRPIPTITLHCRTPFVCEITLQAYPQE